MVIFGCSWSAHYYEWDTFWVLACASSLRAPYVTVLHYRRKNFSTLNFSSFIFLLFVLKKMKNVIVYVSDSWAAAPWWWAVEEQII